MVPPLLVLLGKRRHSSWRCKFLQLWWPGYNGSDDEGVDAGRRVNWNSGAGLKGTRASRGNECAWPTRALILIWSWWCWSGQWHPMPFWIWSWWFWSWWHNNDDVDEDIRCQIWSWWWWWWHTTTSSKPSPNRNVCSTKAPISVLGRQTIIPNKLLPIHRIWSLAWYIGRCEGGGASNLSPSSTHDGWAHVRKELMKKIAF